MGVLRRVFILRPDPDEQPRALVNPRLAEGSDERITDDEGCLSLQGVVIPVERHENDPQAVKDDYFRQIPMGRWGVPQDVANAVLYFASEEASFVTGQTLCINGGMTPW